MFGSYYLLIASYHSFNSYSAVFTNVGIHNDTFWKRVESLENKCLFCDWKNLYPFCSKDSLGRSGSLVVKRNKCPLIMAILDWGNASRSTRRFINANHVAIGCDVNARATKAVIQQIRNSDVRCE